MVGWSALLIETDDVEGWRAELIRRRAAGELVAAEIVPGERTVLLDGVPDPTAAAAAVGGWTPAADPGAGDGSIVELPTVYDGEDLALVARHWEVSTDEVVERHTGTAFRVAFCGFAPGFGYLTGLPAALAVPRLDTPRPRVPAGSVALAGRYCGVYPGASPGGWLLIGRTERRLFDVEADPPALLSPGTRVRFVHA
jgi:KipI family sensor histidine kinase inhibitor